MDRIAKSVASMIREAAAEMDLFDSAIEAALMNNLQRAVRAGQILNEAKAQAPHGTWEPTLEEHWPQSIRRAQELMKLHKNYNKLDGKGVITVDEALRICSNKKDGSPPKQGRKAQNSALLDSPQETDPSPSQPVDSPPAEEYECPFETPPDDDEPPSEAHEPAAGEEYEDDDGPEVSDDPLKDKKLARSRLVKTIQAAVRAVDDYHEICRSPKRRDEIVQLLQDSERLVWPVK